jgi:hypothetical protein
MNSPVVNDQDRASKPGFFKRWRGNSKATNQLEGRVKEYDEVQYIHEDAYRGYRPRVV